MWSLILLVILGVAVIFRTMYYYKRKEISLQGLQSIVGIFCLIVLGTGPCVVDHFFLKTRIFLETDVGFGVQIFYIGATLFIGSYFTYRYTQYLNKTDPEVLLKADKKNLRVKFAFERVAWLWVVGALFMIGGIAIILYYL